MWRSNVIYLNTFHIFVGNNRILNPKSLSNGKISKKLHQNFNQMINDSSPATYIFLITYITQFVNINHVGFFISIQYIRKRPLISLFHYLIFSKIYFWIFRTVFLSLISFSNFDDSYITLPLIF